MIQMSKISTSSFETDLRFAASHHQLDQHHHRRYYTESLGQLRRVVASLDTRNWVRTIASRETMWGEDYSQSRNDVDTRNWVRTIASRGAMCTSCALATSELTYYIYIYIYIIYNAYEYIIYIFLVMCIHIRFSNFRLFQKTSAHEKV